MNSTNPFDFDYDDQDVKLSQYAYISNDEKNYGELLKINDIVILLNEIPLPESQLNLTSVCPQGFNPTTKRDIYQIIQDLYNLKEDNLRIQEFLSNLKITIIPGEEQEIALFSKGEDESQVIYCKQQIDQFEVYLQGYEGYDMLEGHQYELTILNSNVEQVYVEDDQGQVFTSKSFNYTHKVNEMGFNSIKMKLLLFGGDVAVNCITIFKQNQKNIFSAESSLYEENITTIALENGVQSTNYVLQSEGSAPISPLLNSDNALYIYFSDKQQQLTIQKLFNNGTIIGDSFKTNQIGVPFDITSTPFGYIVLAKYDDENVSKLWASAFNDDNTLMWTRNIIDFDKKKNLVNDQIKFYDKSCKLFSGMEKMTLSVNGRLNYARGKVQIIFSHSNNFNEQEENLHCADSLISLDALTGYDQQIFWQWGASHSLLQNIHYDGKYLFIASLSDTYPQNILFKKCDVDTYICILNDKLVEGGIIGDTSGKSAGRQGGFIDSKEDKNIKYFVYSRKTIQSKNKKSDKNISITKSELAIIKFDQNLQFLQKFVIKEGEDASRINAIKSSRYGQNILIGISLQPKQDQTKFNRNSIRKVDKSYLILIDEKNMSNSQEIELKDIQLGASDDWQILSDGSIGFTYVHLPGGQLYYTKLEKLNMKDFPDFIPSSYPLFGQSKYLNNYTNDCLNENDENHPHQQEDIVIFPVNEKNNIENPTNILEQNESPPEENLKPEMGPVIEILDNNNQKNQTEQTTNIKEEQTVILERNEQISEMTQKNKTIETKEVKKIKKIKITKQLNETTNPQQIIETEESRLKEILEPGQSKLENENSDDENTIEINSNNREDDKKQEFVEQNETKIEKSIKTEEKTKKIQNTKQLNETTNHQQIIETEESRLKKILEPGQTKLENENSDDENTIEINSYDREDDKKQEFVEQNKTKIEKSNNTEEKTKIKIRKQNDDKVIAEKLNKILQFKLNFKFLSIGNENQENQQLQRQSSRQYDLIPDLKSEIQKLIRLVYNSKCIDQEKFNQNFAQLIQYSEIENSIDANKNNQITINQEDLNKNTQYQNSTQTTKNIQIVDDDDETPDTVCDCGKPKKLENEYPKFLFQQKKIATIEKKLKQQTKSRREQKI